MYRKLISLTVYSFEAENCLHIITSLDCFMKNVISGM